ncbi:DNA integration/recombination/inversion protein [Octadecabacter arcticus 238]|uniref:DNA integration/recombination/inversion protein n=1 Tax=Octadecabacter arcticus 238 TaxID=391616 RepID=M9RMK6_9RHOB|nr:recombinase family protein [Octadecabacter arcticus]AGI71025.1 DNA integration/recombination/inversion protein [Octadecabacter arcticus 238]
MNKIRCAIYTRKSSEEGLEQEFNSLDAQREACASYVASQKHEGWVLLPAAYEDGGLSGGSLERPALQRLMQDMRDGHVDQIIVYKIDRLTRSLADFSKIVDVLDAAGASFVSVTQSFNTATSMGRLTLNMLLSFAQFEREVTAERIRDKIAASKRKGLWMGGNVPLGYDPDGRTLKINEVDARIIRTIYDLYKEHRNIRIVKTEADKRGLKTALRTLSSGRMKGGTAFSFGHIYHILSNPIYAGRIRHKTKVWPGQHPALIDPADWDAVQEQLKAGAVRSRAGKGRNDDGQKKQVSLLTGKVFDETGDRLTPSHTKTGKGRRLRYYVSHRLIRSSGPKDPSGWRLPAPELETLVTSLIRTHLGTASVRANLISLATTDEIVLIANKMTELSNKENGADGETNRIMLGLIERVLIVPGKIQITISASAIAEILTIDAKRISDEHLSLQSDFRTRKRGVETKLILADATGTCDETLFKNIALAHRYFDLIRSGKTYAEIAEAEGASKRRVQQLIELAFLAPDIVRDVWEGGQPVGLTSHWLKSHAFSPVWTAQRDLFRAL